jgi:glycosyltransferase involved in cell wall biosynthesis
LDVDGSPDSMTDVVCVAPMARHRAVEILADSLAAFGAGPLRSYLLDDTLAVPANVPPEVVHQLRLTCDDDDLARHLQPWILGALTSGSRPPMVALAPSTLALAPLDVLTTPFGGTGIHLVRRLLRPDPASARSVRWSAVQPAVLVVGEGSAPFLRWCGQRALDAAVGLAPQDWLTEAAAAFDHVVVADPGVGVDATNAVERGAQRVGTRWMVGEGPLRTFHFPGFDPRRPWLALGAAEPRGALRLSEHPDLAVLYREYADALGGEEPVTGHAVLPTGLVVDAAMRYAYRGALRAARLGRGELPPDPWRPGQYTRFLDFFNEPDPDSELGFSRYVWAVYRTRPGLDRVFTDVQRADRAGFIAWLHRYLREEAVPAVIELPPHPGRRRWPGPPLRHGVNVAGYLGADLGLGVAARRIVSSLATAGVELDEVAFHRTFSPQAPVAERPRPIGYDTSVVVVTAEQLPLFAAEVGDGFFADRHTIGYWYWELETFPPDQLGALDHVDEVWVATRHVLDTIRAVTTKPVHHLPIPLELPVPSDRTRADFGLDDRYTFLFAFDFQSIVERKNPLGLVEAYRRAFGRADAARLVLKTINGELWVDPLERLRLAIADRPDITLMDAYLTTGDQAALMACCDCYVSLHRAEGLGLTLADAMGLGKPVIATRYSGNLDFMDDANSFLVDYRMTAVPPGTPAYPAGAPWADPDLDQAAAYMRRLAADPASGRAVGARAHHDIASRWTTAAMGLHMRARLEEVWGDGRVSRT